MSFNIGLSALNAAQQEINVTGNNIANASTTGFKSSRTNFGDVYAASVLGGGSAQQGGGVSLQSISQNFSQGNINFTNNTLDMAINGEGFFVLSGESGTSYTRAGAFGTDKDGYIVNTLGERLQGFAATDTGQPSGGGPLTNLVIETGEIAPRATTEVESVINLDGSALPSSIVGTSLMTNFGRSGDPQIMGAVDPRHNGFDSNSLIVRGSDGVDRQVNVPANASANQVAQLFSGVNGVTARGSTTMFISNLQVTAPDTTVRFSINGREFEADPADTDHLEDLAADINAIVSNLSARVVDGRLEVTHNVGSDLIITPGSGGTGQMTVQGSEIDTGGALTPSANATTVDVSGNDVMVIGGKVNFTLDENVTVSASDVDVNGDPLDQTVQTGSIFGDISTPEALAGEPFETNQFDPRNPDTYYRSTAVPIYDSLGNQHALTMYFVRERPESGETNNVWSVYLQIGGQDIGYDPNSLTGEPVLARHEIRFDNNGQYDSNNPPIVITNWQPRDALGRALAAGPVPGNPNVANQTTNSNFALDLSRMTQFGGDFSVQSNNQDGFAKGQLTGLDINNRGLISARFSNGQSRAVGEVALANFSNPGGLSNLGGTRFAETSESGSATVSGAGTASLGVIQAGALEESNVDLPEQLVQLIVSQRNYQAAAQIISATDQAMQTVINL